jgi:hypothetical protein
MITEENLIALVDGEASEAERAELEAAAAADPELARRIDAHRRLRANLSRAYAPVSQEPAPSSLVDLAIAGPTANVVRLTTKRRSRAFEIGALAACLIGGVLLGTLAMRPGRLVVADAQGLRAAGALSHALDVQLASEAEPNGALRVTMSFRNRTGGYCRLFETPRLAGLACKEGRDWRIALAEAAPAERPDYRMAASPAALAVMSATISGEPLDAAQERAARAQRWRHAPP